jgi:predicted ribonuclease YlaK
LTEVITELDGLRSNQSTLGTAAQEALAYLEQIFSQNKSQGTKQGHLRIQTSHNNFLHDISMRSEQFMWGETDRNLDDLILSVCIWWAGQPSTDAYPAAQKVCLVTSDRNLSVKARARDIRVADISSLSRIIIK